MIFFLVLCYFLEEDAQSDLIIFLWLDAKIVPSPGAFVHCKEHIVEFSCKSVVKEFGNDLMFVK